MSKLEWDKIGERLFETGVDRGVVYPAENGAYPSGAAWSGLINVNESPSGAEPTPLYADNIKYLNLISSALRLTLIRMSFQNVLVRRKLRPVSKSVSKNENLLVCHTDPLLVTTPMVPIMDIRFIWFMAALPLLLKKRIIPSMNLRKRVRSLGKSLQRR